ncbi:MAG: MAPEG family protein [Bdellovibrionales bacterium]|nr:MAPEG family protein [Bdellovibrionales bacterium]
MITLLYAGILGLFYFKISMDTIKARKKHQISMGYGKDNEIIQYVSAHNNFASYVIFLLLLLYLVESSQMYSPYLLHGLGTTFTLGRFFHYFAFVAGKMNFKRRVLGMQMTLIPLLILSLLCIFASLKSWI